MQGFGKIFVSKTSIIDDLDIIPINGKNILTLYKVMVTTKIHVNKYLVNR